MSEYSLDNINYNLFQLVDDGDYVIGQMNGVMVVGQVKGRTVPAAWVQDISGNLLVAPVSAIRPFPIDGVLVTNVVEVMINDSPVYGIVMGSTTPTLWVKDLDGQTYFIPICDIVVISDDDYNLCVSHTELSWSELSAILDVELDT